MVLISVRYRPLQQYLGFLPGAGYGQFRHKADSPDCKIQRSGRNSQRDWCMSRVTAIISALVICIIVCLSWAVNHYRDNAITTKPSATKMPENWSWRTRNYWHADASAWCCCARCKIHRELADAGENDALRDDVAAGRRQFLSKQSIGQCVKPPPPPAWIMQPPPDWQTPLNGIISPSERGWSLPKNNWKEPKYINEQLQIELHIQWATRTIIISKQYTRASAGSINA